MRPMMHHLAVFTVVRVSSVKGPQFRLHSDLGSRDGAWPGSRDFPPSRLKEPLLVRC